MTCEDYPPRRGVARRSRANARARAVGRATGAHRLGGPDQPGTSGPRRRYSLHDPQTGIPTHVEVRPPNGGLREVSFAMCEQVRSLATERLGPRPFGSVPAAALRAVEDSLRLLLRL